MAQAIAMIGNAAEPADLSTPEVRAYLFHREGAAAGSRFVAVAWARGASPVLLDPQGGSAVRMLDVMGAPLSGTVTVDDRPVYLLADSREALERALGAAPGGT
jgi:hypothetical protein